MVKANEVVSLIIASLVVLFLLLHRKRMNSIPQARTLGTGFGFLYAGLVLTVLEGLFFQDILNAAEHVLYLASSACLACWVWRVVVREGERS